MQTFLDLLIVILMHRIKKGYFSIEPESGAVLLRLRFTVYAWPLVAFAYLLFPLLRMIGSQIW